LKKQNEISNKLYKISIPVLFILGLGAVWSADYVDVNPDSLWRGILTGVGIVCWVLLAALTYFAWYMYYKEQADEKNKKRDKK